MCDSDADVDPDFNEKVAENYFSSDPVLLKIWHIKFLHMRGRIWYGGCVWWLSFLISNRKHVSEATNNEHSTICTLCLMLWWYDYIFYIFHILYDVLYD